MYVPYNWSTNLLHVIPVITFIVLRIVQACIQTVQFIYVPLQNIERLACPYIHLYTLIMIRRWGLTTEPLRRCIQTRAVTLTDTGLRSVSVLQRSERL